MLKFKLNYDWKDPDGSDATGYIKATSLEDPDYIGYNLVLANLLKEHHEEIEEEFGNDCVSLVPDRVNGERLCDLAKGRTPGQIALHRKNQQDYGFVVAACLLFLDEHPDTDAFRLEGLME